MNSISITDLYNYFKNSSGTCTDTRNIMPNSMFFALKGNNFDGNKFVTQALREGAKYAVCSNPELADNRNVFYFDNTLDALQQLAHHHRMQFNIPVIAITGSNGKTTTKELFNVVLSKKFKTLATKGNLNNHIGVPLTLLQLNNTHQLAIIEMGANHQGEIDMLCKIANPGLGIITNIGKAHLEGFGGIDGVIKGKTELYHYLNKNNGTILFNKDNHILHQYANGINQISYAFGQEADCKGEIIKEQPFVFLKYQYKNNPTQEVKSHLIGVYNAENILSAICVAQYFNIDAKLIAAAIESYIPDNSRSQIISKKNNTIVLDAYNANPSSMKAALDNFNSMKTDNKIVCLGDMFELGEESPVEHNNIIKEALKGKYNKVIFVGPNFGKYKYQYEAEFIDDTPAAIEFLKKMKKENCVFLIKGSRSMNMEKLLEAFE